MNWTITDLNNKPIQIEDLERAIEQADRYRHYHHENPGYKALDERLKAYWTDIYNKLMAIKAETEKGGRDENH